MKTTAGLCSSEGTRKRVKCPHVYSAVNDTQGRRRRRKQGREKGETDPASTLGEQDLGRKAAAGKAEVRAGRPLQSENTAEGTRLRLLFIAKAHRIVHSHKTTFHNKIGNRQALPGAGDRRTIRRK